MDIRRIVTEALALVGDEDRRHAIAALLIPPEEIQLTFEYATQVERRECWIIARGTEVQLAFCPGGFGSDHWGVLPVGSTTMARDDS